MILDVDIGNTRCKWRLVGENRREPESGNCTLEELWELDVGCLRGPVPQRIRVSSVRGAAVDRMIQAWGIKGFGIAAEFAVAESSRAGVVNAYAEPQRLGVDRWLAMLAAFQGVQRGICVIDCGSAITIDLVDDEGFHRGGYIAPGLEMMRDSLLRGTGQVRVEKIVPASDTRPGKSTGTAVAAGTLMAATGAVDQALRACRAQCGRTEVIFTGGDGALIRETLDVQSRFNPNLVLEGLSIALP